MRVLDAQKIMNLCVVQNFYNNNFQIGILGGGQLGRMLIQEGINLNLSISVLDPNPSAPCATIASNFVVGDFTDYQTVLDFGKGKDLLTVEIENVNTLALEELEKKGVKVFPSASVLNTVKDKGLQKEFYKKHQIPTADFSLATGDISGEKLSFPFVQKLRTGGYDGKGVQVISSEKELENSFAEPSVIEECVAIEKEISVIVARNERGEIKTFPAVEMEFNATANLVELLSSPASLSNEKEERANEIAEQIARELNLVGILAVEFFLDKNGEIIVNEIAPRPHNSGHQTIEGNITSQYAQHWRAILGLPLGNTSIIKPSVMLNVLGAEGYTGNANYKGLHEVLEIEGVFVHLYGKEQTKPFRKMGHITVLEETLEKAKSKAKQVKEILEVIS